MSDDVKVSAADEFPPIPRSSQPITRKPIQLKPFLNPLENIDWDKISDKKEAYLLGFINGQQNTKDRR